MKLLALTLLLPFAFCELTNESVNVIKSVDISSRGLQDDIKDFEALIPRDKILGTILTYIVTDQEVQTLYTYVTSSQEFKKIYTDAIKSAAVRELIELLEGYGLPVIKWLNEITTLLLLPSYPQARISPLKATKAGISGLVDEVLNLLPREKLIKLFIEKMIKSPEFRQLQDNLISQQTGRAVLEVVANRDVRKAYEELNKRGVDLAQIAKQVLIYILDIKKDQ